jgi:alpha-beta hydrolase superfamily lysophospholipase
MGARGRTARAAAPPSWQAVSPIDALGVSVPVVVGGLSMGGYVALAFARRHQQRLRGLLLIDQVSRPSPFRCR